MPFGTFLTLAGCLIVPDVVGCHGESTKGNAAGGVFELRIAPEPANKNHFVNGLCHRSSFTKSRHGLRLIYGAVSWIERSPGAGLKKSRHGLRLIYGAVSWIERSPGAGLKKSRHGLRLIYGAVSWIERSPGAGLKKSR